MLNKNIERIFNEEALKLINSKNDDYANPTDFYANFRLCEQAGIPMFIGVHVRMLDKISRLNSFIERFNRTGEITANHESIEDTLLDTINYAAITLDTYRQYKGVQNHEHQSRTTEQDIGRDSEGQAGEYRTHGRQDIKSTGGSGAWTRIEKGKEGC
jgi:hypothetical protein